MTNNDTTNDFAAWLAEAEEKSNITIVADEPKAPATKKAYCGDRGWVMADWNREDPKLHKCMACGGNGIWSPPVYARRGKTGACHKCNGAGHFKTSAAERSRAKAYRTLTTATKLESAKAEIMAEHGELIQWLRDNSNWNDFARDLISGQYGFDKRGKLSEKQLAAANRMMAKMLAKDAAKAEAKKAEVAAATANDADSATEIDLTDVPSGYYAVPDGETRLKVRINRPGKQSNWHGFTFVTDGAAYGQSKRYGRQAPGKMYSGMIIKQLTAIAADPGAASLAYGKLTGTCGVCGLKLENEESVARGIGPVCAQKTGW